MCCAKLVFLPAVVAWQVIEEVRDKLAAKYQELQLNSQHQVGSEFGVWGGVVDSMQQARECWLSYPVSASSATSSTIECSVSSGQGSTCCFITALY